MQNILNQDRSQKMLTDEVANITAINNDQNYPVSCYKSERDRYRAEFKNWSKKTAQAILEMSRIVYDADQNLSKSDFKLFVEEIEYANSPATVRKFMKIGEKYEAFYKYAEYLPNSWTTLYEITQLPADVFEKLVENQNSLIHITGEQIKTLKNISTTAPVAEVAAVQADAISKTVDASKTDTTSPEAILSVPSAVPTTNNDMPSVSDQEFAKQATDSVLERANASASSTLAVEVTDADDSYKITLCFKSKPTDAAIKLLATSISSTVSFLDLNCEINTPVVSLV